MPQLSRRTKFTIVAGVGVVLLAGGLMFSPVALPEIVLPAERLITVSGFPITNTILASWLSILVLLAISYAATRNLQLVPTGLQNLVEFVFEAFLGLTEDVTGNKQKARTFFPIVMTIFLFVIVSNWMGLLPGFSTIGVIKETEPGSHGASFDSINLAGVSIAYTPLGKKVEAQELNTEGQQAAARDSEGENPTGIIGVFVPLFRSANTEVNTTLAIALIAMFLVEYYGIKTLGLTYGTKFLNLGKVFKGQIVIGLLDVFVGLLETLSEIARVISFTFRLFGNVFAGEVLLAVIAFLVPWVAALPFMGLELFVGFIQAFVFAMLTLVFLTMATMHPHGGGGHESHGE